MDNQEAVSMAKEITRRFKMSQVSPYAVIQLCDHIIDMDRKPAVAAGSSDPWQAKEPVFDKDSAR